MCSHGGIDCLRYVPVSFCGKCLILLLGELLCQQAKLIEWSSHSLVPLPSLPFCPITLCSHCWWVDWWVGVFFHHENAAFDCVFELLLFSLYCLLHTVLMVMLSRSTAVPLEATINQYYYWFTLYSTKRLHCTTAVLIALYSASTSGVLVLPSHWYIVVLVPFMVPLSQCTTVH